MSGLTKADSISLRFSPLLTLQSELEQTKCAFMSTTSSLPMLSAILPGRFPKDNGDLGIPLKIPNKEMLSHTVRETIRVEPEGYMALRNSMT